MTVYVFIYEKEVIECLRETPRSTAMPAENFAAYIDNKSDGAGNGNAAQKPAANAEQSWLTGNVVDPFVNGTGLLQVYDTLAGKPAEALPVADARAGSGAWVAQTVAGAAGAIIPYALAGKAAGKYIANEGLAQIVGAGAYEALKKPHEGETRIGNSVGTMAGFAVFNGGNGLVERTGALVENRYGQMGLRNLSRLGVGSAGGLVSYETSNKVAALTGGKDAATLSGGLEAMASGALINTGLPVAHAGLNRLGSMLKAGAKPEAAPITRLETTANSSPLAGIAALSELAKVGKIARIAEIAPETGANVVPFDKTSFGTPDQLGASLNDQGVNFAVTSKGAIQMSVHIFDDPTARDASQVLPMFKSGDVWHRQVDGLKAGALYLYTAEGAYTPREDGSRFNGIKYLIDPYAKAVSDDKLPTDGSQYGYDNTNPNDPDKHLRPSTMDSTGEMPKAVVVDNTSFDWQGVSKPHVPLTDEVLYEVNVRGFTSADQSLGDAAGTYKGLQAKIPFMKAMGYTTVELMPIMQGDRSAWFGVNPQTGEPLLDSWGYNTVAYQSPDGGISAAGKAGQQVNEFKQMVREFHRNGMEVVLDIVFNHTREGGPDGPTFAFKGLDNSIYYMTIPGHPDLYVDHTGCGNTMNTNDPRAQKFIIDTLRYWSTEMQVDGFRFDLGSVFKYDKNNQPQEKTDIMRAIEDDPVIGAGKVKLVSEPWATDRYDFGHFSDQLWSELNGPFRDDVRSFVKSDDGKVGAMADHIVGSPKLFDQSRGRYPINMVANHDGMPMNDLVSYNGKHNEANGENNRDGNDDNHSWNGGVEGPLENSNLPPEQKATIEALRTRQIKNMMSFLFLSRGVPMLLSGDEMRRTNFGNNNVWNQDKLNALDWSLLDKNADTVRFTKMMIDLRNQHQIGRSAPGDVTWHGVEPFKPDWSSNAHFIAWQLDQARAGVKPLYSAFNSFWEPLTVKLPQGNWRRLVDTNLPTGQDIVGSEQGTDLSDTYVIQPRSGIVLEGR